MISVLRGWCEQLLRIPPDPGPPAGEDRNTRIFRAAPNYFRLLLLSWAAKNFFLLIALLVGALIFLAAVISEIRNQADADSISIILYGLIALTFVFFVLQALFQLAVLRLNYEKRWYIVTDRSLRVREGVVLIREMTVSFANIQDVAVTQGPIERLLGLSNVRVTTAGGGGSGHTQTGKNVTNMHQAWFRGIENAEEVRTLILNRLRALKDSGLGDLDEPVAAPSAAPATTRPEFTEALKSVLDEARQLRLAAEAVSERPATKGLDN